MAEILIGNIKGPQGAKGDKGDKGDTGPQGPAGPQGATGPMPALVNGFTTTEAGIAALDAAAGKTLKDEVTQLNSDMAAFVITNTTVSSYDLESGAHVSTDVAVTVPEGYKYLGTFPQANDPIGNTSHIEITVYRRTDNVFSWIAHNAYIAKLTGTVKFINYFYKEIP